MRGGGDPVLMLSGLIQERRRCSYRERLRVGVRVRVKVRVKVRVRGEG